MVPSFGDLLSYKNAKRGTCSVYFVLGIAKYLHRNKQPTPRYTYNKHPAYGVRNRHA